MRKRHDDGHRISTGSLHVADGWLLLCRELLTGPDKPAAPRAIRAPRRTGRTAALTGALATAALTIAIGGCGGGAHSTGTTVASVNPAQGAGASTTATAGTPTAGTPTGSAASTATATTATTAVPAGAAHAASGATAAGASSNGAQTGAGAASKAGGGSSSGKAAHGHKHSHSHKPADHGGSGSGSGGGSGSSGAGRGSGGGSDAAVHGLPYEVSTISMEPTYKPETTVYFDTSRVHPTIGDVVVFYLPKGAAGGACRDVPVGGAPCQYPVPGLLTQMGMKRVVGLPGDTIAVRDGEVIRNGRQEPEPPTEPCGQLERTACEYPKAITVPDGYYYVMADNRAAAKEDSRVFGAVPQAAILGIVEGS